MRDVGKGVYVNDIQLELSKMSNKLAGDTSKSTIIPDEAMPIATHESLYQMRHLQEVLDRKTKLDMKKALAEAEEERDRHRAFLAAQDAFDNIIKN